MKFVSMKYGITGEKECMCTWSKHLVIKTKVDGVFSQNLSKRISSVSDWMCLYSHSVPYDCVCSHCRASVCILSVCMRVFWVCCHVRSIKPWAASILNNEQPGRPLHNDLWEIFYICKTSGSCFPTISGHDSPILSFVLFSFDTSRKFAAQLVILKVNNAHLIMWNLCWSQWRANVFWSFWSNSILYDCCFSVLRWWFNRGAEETHWGT